MLTLSAIATGMTPARSEARAPQMRRDSTSRPTSSVPSRWGSDGGLRTATKLVAIGIEGRQARRGEGDDDERHTTAAAATGGRRARRRARPIIRGAVG